jgi:hypothetical protein
MRMGAEMSRTPPPSPGQTEGTSPSTQAPLTKANKSGGKKNPKRPVSTLSGSGDGYVSEYVHYRTGKLMVAKAYGYKAWPFGYGRR